MTRLVLLNQNSYRLSLGSIIGVDLSSFEEDDYISVTLPDFAEEITKASSRIELTSNEDVDFSVGPTDSAPFTDATENENGSDLELQFPLSSFSTIDRSNVTGVRFRVLGTGDDYQFKVMSVRCISQDWKYASLDMDTVAETLVRPVSPTGTASYTEGFTWPTLWQPLKPKDFSVSSEIFTGSIADDNSLTIYFRGSDVSRSLMSDFDSMTVGDMDGTTPEQGPEESEAPFYLYSRIRWDVGSGTTIRIGDTDSTFYSFTDLDLAPNTRYLVTWTVKGESIRVRIDELMLGYKQIQVYDTDVIHDTRIQKGIGSFGWSATLGDGDAVIDNIRHRSANYGNLITREYRSSTPVTGAQLAETSTEPIELLDAIGSGPFGGIVTSQKDDSFKVETKGMMKGIATGGFRITDWENTTIRFSIRRPEGEILAYLYGDSGNIIQIPIPPGTPGQWQKVKQRMTDRPDQTGRYQLVIVKVSSPVTDTWYLKDISVRSRVVAWSARGKDDPWGMAGDQWIPFHDATNAYNSGVLLKEPGRGLQIQAEMLAGEGSIYEFKALPKYAEPGRFVWDQLDVIEPKHTVTIVTDINGLTVDFAADLNLDETDDRTPISYTWYFGTHGSAIGKTVRKVFPTPGTYTAVLRVGYRDGTVQTPDTWVQNLTV